MSLENAVTWCIHGITRATLAYKQFQKEAKTVCLCCSKLSILRIQLY